MGTAVFGIAVSGLQAAQSALETASNNISNVNTAGYHRQVVNQGERSPFFAGFGYIGRGVDTAQVSRVYDQYLDTRLSGTTSANSYYQTQGTLINQLDNMLALSGNGLSPSVQTFFNSLQTLSSMPNNIPARQTVINSGQAMVGQIQAMSSQLTQVRNNVNSQIQSTIGDINSYAQQIATLNTQILALNQGPSRLPNDVLDQRDQLVQKMSQLVNVNVVQQSDGTYSVFIGNGQSLVLGANVNQLTTAQSPADPQTLEVAYNQNGTQVILPESLVTGGQLGGLLNFRADTLNRSDADLGRLAISLSDAMNRQYRVGRDLNNNTVTPTVSNPALGQFFTDLSSIQTSLGGALSAQQQVALLRQASSSFNMVTNDPTMITTASSLKANTTMALSAAKLTTTSGGANTGTMTVTATQGTVGPFNPVPPITITATGPATFTASGGYSVSVNGSTLTLTNANGVTAQLLTTGTPNAGDTFSVRTSNTGNLSATAVSMVAGNVNVPITVTNTGAGTYSATGGYSVSVSGSTLTLVDGNGVTVQVQTAGAAGVGDQFTVGSANVGHAFISSVSQVAGETPTALGSLTAPITLTYSAATQTFSATGPSTYTVAPSQTIAGGFVVTDTVAANGVSLQFQMSGTPANGDQFVLNTKQTGPNSADNSPTDNSNLRNITSLQTQNTMASTPSGGTTYMPAAGSPVNATFQNFFGQTVSYVGSVANTVKSAADSQTTALNQIQQTQQSFSGVNLDEEAAKLIQYQQAYQASSKVIQIAQQIFNSLLQLG